MDSDEQVDQSKRVSVAIDAKPIINQEEQQAIDGFLSVLAQMVARHFLQSSLDEPKNLLIDSAQRELLS